jgi:hypothetical protein
MCHPKVKGLSDNQHYSIRRFQDYSSDLLHSDAPTFENALNAFLDFCESDQLMMPLTTPLKEENVDVAKFWGDMISSNKVTLPTNERQKVCLLYQLLLNVRNNKFSVAQFGVNVFHASSTNQSIYRFNEVFSRPLIRELGRKLDDVEDQSSGVAEEVTDVTSEVEGASAEPGAVPIPVGVTVQGIKTPERETEDIIASLADRYQELGERSDKAARYSRRTSFAFYLFAGGLIITLVLATPSVVFLRLILPEYLAGALAWTLGSLIAVIMFQRRFKKSKLDREQRLFLSVYALASELRPYPSSAPISNASRDLEYIIGELDACWVVRFRLAEQTLSSLADFRTNLRKRLLPALTTGKTDDVKLSAWILAKLCPLLVDEHPSISTVEALNSALSSLPEPKMKTDIKFHVKVREWWARHSVARSAGVALVCVSVGFAIILGGQYLGFSREGFLAGVAGSIALYVGYLTSPRWKKGGTE